MRQSTTTWFAAGALALGLTSCPERLPEVTRLAVRDPRVLATWVHPKSGDTVRVMNGGYGSALAADPAHPGRFYMLSDRGPNYENGEEGGIAFPVPDFTPQIGVFEREGDALVRRGLVTLKDAHCRPLSGLPLPAGRPGATGEVGYTVEGTPLPGDSNGVDTEGLVALRDGTFWVSDEYGPYILHVDAEGCTRERFAPGSGARALPQVVAKRRVNRGFEALTTPDEGKTLVAMLQAPLDNPKAAGRASRLVRLLVLDTRTGATRQHAYLLDAPTLGVSDLQSLGGTRYLVLERDGKFGSDSGAVKRLYSIDLAGATDLSDPANGPTGRRVDGKTLEELTADAADPWQVLRDAGIRPVSKALRLDLLRAVPGYPHDKIEGMTLVDRRTLAFINDDDFGVTDADGGLAPKWLPASAPRAVDRNEVVLLKARW